MDDRDILKIKGPVIFYGWGGGRWILGGAIREFSSLKRGGGIPKVEGERGLMGHSRENWRGGGHAKFFRDNKKNHRPPPLPIKNERSLKQVKP